MPEESISFPDLNTQEYLVKAFQAASETSTHRGVIAALRRLDDRITPLVVLTRNRALAMVKLYILLLMSVIADYKRWAVREFVKDNVEGVPDLGPEAVNALARLASATDPDDVIDDEHVVAEQIIENLKEILPIVPVGVNKEAVVQTVMASYQAGWQKVVYVDIPSDLKPFFDEMVEALDSGSFETVKAVLESELLRWNDRLVKEAY